MRTGTPERRAKLAALTDGQRTVLQVAGVIGLLTGLGLVVYGFVRFTSAFGSFDGPPIGAFAAFAAGGMISTISWGLVGFAFMRPLSEVTATETGRATEYGAERVGAGLGRGLGSAGIGTSPQTIVKVKCRACGALDSEDAKFCSACGEAI